MAGRYNEPVVMYDRFTSKNAYGELVEEYRSTFETRAAVEWNGGSRTVENDEIVHDYIKRFTLRSYVHVSDTSQIEWQNHRYRVLTVERRREYNDQVVTAELINE